MSLRNKKLEKKVYGIGCDLSIIGVRHIRPLMGNFKKYSKFTSSILKKLENLLIIQEEIIRNTSFNKTQTKSFRMYISNLGDLLKYTSKYNEKYIKPYIEQLSRVEMEDYHSILYEQWEMLTKTKYSKYTFDKKDLINDVKTRFNDLTLEILRFMSFSNSDSYDNYAESVIGEISRYANNNLESIINSS